jgi:RNA polymerase sigma-70 factor (ECF subfamily)
MPRLSLINSFRFLRADLCRRLGRIPEARASYEKALALAQQEPERRFLMRRLEELK